MEKNELLKKAGLYVANLFDEKSNSSLTYHNLKHTQRVVEQAIILAEAENLNSDETEILCLAAWFHDVGYLTQKENHEKISCDEATIFLKKNQYPDDKIELVCHTILATQYPQKPESRLQKILCDADLSSIGSPKYFKRSKRLRKEWELLDNKFYEECDWLKYEKQFLTQHQFHTVSAQKIYTQNKEDNILFLEKKWQHQNEIDKNNTVDNHLLSNENNTNPQISSPQISAASQELHQASPDADSPNPDLIPKKKKAKKKKKDDRGRGVETMFRTASKTHINLSAMSDSKANIMLSINALIVSITLSALMPKLDSNPHLIIPTVMLVFTCLATIVFATLSTKPKISHGKFTKEDIQNKQSNLLFFGNFHNMRLEDFEWGMQEMMKDNNFLYGTLTRDLYFLGIVLAKKYTYLRICYTIFMYGLILSVIAFGISLSFFDK